MAPLVVWLALLALPVHAIPGWSLQPAELFGLPVVALAAWRVLRDRVRVRFCVVDAGALAWFVAVATNGAVVLMARADPAMLRDVGVSAYVTLLYFAVRVLAEDDEILDVAPGALVVSATIAGALGVIGAALSAGGIDTALAFDGHSVYPYLGTAPRARALTATPNMLASILMLALLLLAARAAPRLAPGYRRWAAALLAMGFAMTFSKTLVPLAVGLVVAWALRRPTLSRMQRIGLALACVLAAASFGVFAHLVVDCAGERGRLEQSMFIAGAPLYGSGRCAVYPTNYFFNKRASMAAVKRSWPWGIGPGGHPAFVRQLQHEGSYPRNLWPATPHSSYTGAAAELGLAGILGLSAYLASLAIGIRQALSRDGTRALAVAGAAALAALSIEAIATDVMHFRHYAWLAALIGSAAARARG